MAFTAGSHKQTTQSAKVGSRPSMQSLTCGRRSLWPGTKIHPPAMTIPLQRSPRPETISAISTDAFPRAPPRAVD
jgi:hypothetical protein